MKQGVFVLRGTATQEWKKLVEESKPKDLKEKKYLFQSIERKIIETVLGNLDNCSSKTIWNSMAKKYHDSRKVKIG